MLPRLRSVMKRPGSMTAMFTSLFFLYLLVDSAYLVATTAVTPAEAVFMPSGHALFIRAVAVVILSIAAFAGELVFSWYRGMASDLELQKSRLQTLYDKNPSAVITLDRDLVVSYLNDKAAQTVGRDAEHILGQPCYAAIIGRDTPCDGCLVGQVFETGNPHSRIKHEVTVAGRENWLSQVWYPLMGPDGRIESVVEIASDVSAVKLDPLTSLPNRLLLRDRLEIALAGAKRHEQLLAVLFMDIDDFKRVNDTMGHAAGDALLAGFAERLRGIVRQDETLARISGDEFVMLLPSVTSREEVGSTAARILEHLAAPFVLNGREHPITASVGVAIFEGGEMTAEELLERADQAMYAAKSQGGNTFRTSGTDVLMQNVYPSAPS